ncbi:MAG: hypothetical protein MI975_22550 [Cytophagales bacterium]|nr:hypothetical protein [Cytophagales bacterium]
MMLHILLYVLLFLSSVLCAQDYRPGLFFREDFKETPAEIPISQKHIANPDVIFTAYGPGQDSLKKSNHEKPVDDPYYMWSGLTVDSWAVTFKHRDSFADLSSFAKIRWRTKQAGFHNLRIVLRLADGRWFISDQCDGPSADWRIKEFNLNDITWWSFDITQIKEIKPVSTDEIDLTKVDEIGCTDLMRGGKSRACSRLDWIEVYGKPAPRN